MSLSTGRLLGIMYPVTVLCGGFDHQASSVRSNKTYSTQLHVHCRIEGCLAFDFIRNFDFDHKLLLFVLAVCLFVPEGRQGMSDVSPPPFSPESQGCHLIPLYYLLSCSSA